jgi:hypothetical protein
LGRNKSDFVAVRSRENTPIPIRKLSPFAPAKVRVCVPQPLLADPRIRAPF